MGTTDFIPPDVRARLRDLRLFARSSAGGDGLGQHASRSRGAGLEFAQYRAYEPGDEPRRIDWKLYARSDRYFVREAERDSPLTAWLILDATESMRQTDTARPDFSKLDAAKSIAACVIELALRQGDRFGVIALGGAAPVLVPTGAGPRQRDRCLLELARIAAAGSWPDAVSLRPLWERIAPSALVVFLSDFFDDATVELAEHLASARREVLSVQLLASEERDFPFSGGHRFRDPESAAERRVEASAVRQDFLERFGAARVALARRFAARGIRHVEHVLDEAIDAPLRRLLAPSPRTFAKQAWEADPEARDAAVAPSPPTTPSSGERVGVRGRNSMQAAHLPSANTSIPGARRSWVPPKIAAIFQRAVPPPHPTLSPDDKAVGGEGFERRPGSGDEPGRGKQHGSFPDGEGK